MKIVKLFFNTRIKARLRLNISFFFKIFTLISFLGLNLITVNAQFLDEEDYPEQIRFKTSERTFGTDYTLIKDKETNEFRLYKDDNIFNGPVLIKPKTFDYSGSSISNILFKMNRVKGIKDVQAYSKKGFGNNGINHIDLEYNSNTRAYIPKNQVYTENYIQLSESWKIETIPSRTSLIESNTIIGGSINEPENTQILTYAVEALVTDDTDGNGETPTNPIEINNVKYNEEIGVYIVNIKNSEKEYLIDRKVFLRAYFKNEKIQTIGDLESESPGLVNIINLDKIDKKSLELGFDLDDVIDGSDIETILKLSDDGVIFNKETYGDPNDVVNTANTLKTWKSGSSSLEKTETIKKYLDAGVELSVDAYVGLLEKDKSFFGSDGELTNTKHEAEHKIIQDIISDLSKNPEKLNEVAFSSLDPEQLNKAIQGQECDDAFIKSLCGYLHSNALENKLVTNYLLDIKTDRDKLFKDLNNAKTEEKKDELIDEYNFQLIQKAFEGLDANTNGNDKFYVSACSGDISGCSAGIKAVNCNGDTTCQKQKSIILAKLDASKGNEVVKQSFEGSLILSILNPNNNDWKAARFFGFEENYSNVPIFLKESFPSQICLAKIEGYLDKDRNENGGLTKYGCENDDYIASYDHQIGEFKQSGDPNCINVNLDLRAQRTQITPNKHVSIIYSYFLRAPKNTNINVVLALTYIEGDTRKKELLISEVIKIDAGETTKGFDSVDFLLDVEDISNVPDTIDSFYIGLLALDDNNNPVYSVSTPIALITAGDSFYSEIFDTSQNGGGSSSIATEVNTELTAGEILELI